MRAIAARVQVGPRNAHDEDWNRPPVAQACRSFALPSAAF
jgi:hypothetical protein